MRRAEADSLELPEVVGTAKAALWLGLGERRVRQLCKMGKLPGAYQPSQMRDGKWLIPVATLQEIRARPADFR